MKINLSLLKEGSSKDVQHSYQPKDLDLEFVDLKYVAPVKLTGTVQLIEDTATFAGDLATDIQRVCCRCLKEDSQHLSKSFKLYYDVKESLLLDATDDIRELLIMEHPMNHFCDPQCKGLCPSCGTNLNNKKCDCKVEVQTENSSPLWKQKLNQRFGGK